MQHKCKVTVLKKMLFPELQAQYLADPASGACPFYEEGQEFWFERYAGRDDFWTEGGGAHCAEAWDCISRYIYTALQGGAIMRGWTRDERQMIACCNDGTRPVIFKIERVDYKALWLVDDRENPALRRALLALEGVSGVRFCTGRGFAEVFLEQEVPDQALLEIAAGCHAAVTRIE